MRKNVLQIVAATLILISIIPLSAPAANNAYAQASPAAYSFPQHALTGAQNDAITEALSGRLDGEVTDAYRLSGDLYYVIISQNGAEIGAAVVREGRQSGRMIYHILHAGEALLPEDELMPFISQAAATPNVTIDFSAVDRLTTLSEHVEYLQTAIRDTDGSAPNDAALPEIASYIQHVIGTQATAVLTATENQILVSERDIIEPAEAASAAYGELIAVLMRNNIDLGRPVAAIIRIEGQNIDIDEAAQITFDETLADAIGDSSLMLLIGDNRHAITITGRELRTLTTQYGALTMQIERNSEGVYTIVFIDGDGDIIDRLSAPVTIMLPAAGMFDTVFASFGGAVDNWGGQYDRLAGTIRFSTPFSGSYEVLENLMEVADIEGLSDEMQSAVRFMVSKGFFSLTDGGFDPDAKLTRYDFSATLVRMFFALDRSLETSFIDVMPDSAYYSYIASGEREGLIEGVGENLFAGDRIMTRQEAVTVAARALANRRNYTFPADIDEYIAPFSDADDIAEYAKSTVALAVREGIVTRSASFEPLGEITRAETALIMYRLFLLLYEAPPVEIKMSPLEEAAAGSGSPDYWSAMEPHGDVRSPYTMILVMIIGFVVFCIVLIFCALYGIIVYKKKRAHLKPTEDHSETFEEEQYLAMPGTFGKQFPDAAFNREVLRMINEVDGGARTESSTVTDFDYQILDGIAVLNLKKKGIESLSGIEYFSSLTLLDCANNKLTELDTRQNPMLKQVLCFRNRLTKLDVSNNAALVNLYCYNNQLTELDVSNNIALETLNCSSNRLTKVDISKNTAMTGLHCFSNYMEPNPDISVPDWKIHWSSAGTSWDGSAFQFFPQNTPDA